MEEELIDINFDDEGVNIGYINEIIKIKKSAQPIETKLTLIDLLIKDFLRRRFHLKKDIGYSEMIEIFLQKNKPQIAIFCHEMVKYLFSGEPIDEESLALLLKDTKDMIEKEIYGDTLEKKSKEKGLFSSILGKIKKKSDFEKPDEYNISKQTEKIIEKTILPENSIVMQEMGEKSQLKGHEKVDELLRSRLNLSINKTDYMEENAGESENVRSIDDLERIKQKIKHKKLFIAREKIKEAKQSEQPNQSEQPEQQASENTNQSDQ